MAKSNFSDQQKQAILDAISAAESLTSGEIRVHIESHCKDKSILDRAARVFARLEMHKTELRNGVLIYLALEDHQFAVIGDKGIHAKVNDEFWDMVAGAMKPHFAEGKIIDGLVAGVKLCGDELAQDFPIQEDDENELSNEISFGE